MKKIDSVYQLQRFKKGLAYLILLMLILFIGSIFIPFAIILALVPILVLNITYIIKFKSKPNFYLDIFLCYCLLFFSSVVFAEFSFVTHPFPKNTSFERRFEYILDVGSVIGFLFLYFSITYGLHLLMVKYRKVAKNIGVDLAEAETKKNFLNAVPNLKGNENYIFAEQAWLYWKDGSEEDWELLVELFNLNNFDFTELEEIRNKRA
jgi:hypothetical protein